VLNPSSGVTVANAGLSRSTGLFLALGRPDAIGATNTTQTMTGWERRDAEAPPRGLTFWENGQTERRPGSEMSQDGMHLFAPVR
jgi:hypothetical protein